MQEPALQNHMTREPAGAQEQSSDGADQSWRKAPADARGPVALRFPKSRGEQNAISFQLFSAVSSSDRKSTRLNSSHGYISYAVFCLKKKKGERRPDRLDHELAVPMGAWQRDQPVLQD